MQIEKNIPLKDFTSFHIGGEAEYFVSVHSIEEVREAILFAKNEQLNVTILGGGSNVLIDDGGIRGLVIKMDIGGIELHDEVVTAGAGESWDRVVEYAVERGLWGIENLSGIPGTVGGAVVQNIGAYGQALSQTLLWADAYDRTIEAVVRLTPRELQSGYRDSIFKQEPSRYVVLRAAITLTKDGSGTVSYKDVALLFTDTQPSLSELRSAILHIRANKFPDTEILGTAGSFFKNPVVELSQAEALKAQYPDLPLFPLPEATGVKIPLGWFLDYRHGVIDMREIHVGGVRMYEKQFLVIVAEKNSSSNEVKKLAEIVAKKIYDATKIKIEPEVAYL